MPGVQCDQEKKGNLKPAAQALLLGDSQKAYAINGDLQQMFHWTLAFIENCPDADYLFAAVLHQLAVYLLATL